MNKRVKVASVVNVVVNVFLFFIKVIVGVLFSSISILSDAINSLGDIFTAVIIHYTIRINNLEPDEQHQFGHTRAENIAGYTTGIIMIILAFTIVKVSVEKIIYHEVVVFNNLMLAVVFVTFVLKLGLYIYIKLILKKHNSPALKANAQDHLNDVFMVFGVFIAVLGIKFGYPILDPIIGLLISVMIFKSAIDIIKENLNHLMGVSASPKIIESIEKKALAFSEVLGINLIKSQYLGNKLQIELHIDVDPKTSLAKAHKISLDVREKIKECSDINSCFVHVDPRNK